MSNHCNWSGFSDYSFSSDEEDLREAMKKYHINKNKLKGNSANRGSIADIKQKRIRDAKKRYKDREYSMLSKEVTILRRMVEECESKDPLSDLRTLSIMKFPSKRRVRCKEFEGEMGFELTKGLRREGLDIFRKYEGEDYPEFIQETLEGRRKREPPRLEFDISMINAGEFYRNIERNRYYLNRIQSGKQPISYEIISDDESNTLIVRKADIISIHSSSSITVPSPSDSSSSISSRPTYEEDILIVPPPIHSYPYPTNNTISSYQIHQDHALIHSPTPPISTLTHSISNDITLPCEEPNSLDSLTTPSNKLNQKSVSIISISDSSNEEDLNISDLDLNSDSNSSCSFQSSSRSIHSYRSPIQSYPPAQSSSPDFQDKNLNTLIRESLFATLPSSLYIYNRPALIADLFRIAIEYYPSFIYYHNLLSNPIIQSIQYRSSPDSIIHITLHSSSGQYSGIDLNLSNHSIKFCSKKDHNLHK